MDVEKILKDFNRRLVAVEEFDRQHLEIHRQMMEELKPITEVFNNVNGFRSVSILILKGLIILGAGIGVVVAFIKYLKS